MDARVTAATLVAALVLFQGCIGFGGPDAIKRDLSRSAGVDLDREMEVSVGPVGTWLARKIVKWSDADIPMSLKGIRRVQVGIYRVDRLRRGVDQVNPLTISEFSPDWFPIAQVTDDTDQVFVMTQSDERDNIRKLLVVVAGEEEWVVVKVKGNLTRVIEEAVAMALDESGYDGPPPEICLDEDESCEEEDSEPVRFIA